MRRLLAPILLLALACDRDDAPKEPPAGGGSTVKPPKPAPVLPTTGGPEISKFRRRLVEELDRMEAELDAGTVPEQRLVDAARTSLDHLLTVTRMAVDREAEDMVRKELAMLRERQGTLDRQRHELHAGILEVQQLLQQERPPAGFTVDELKDRLGRKQEEARALEKEDNELRARMKEKEDLLTGGKIPPQGESLHTHELEAAQELEVRLEALEARLKKK